MSPRSRNWRAHIAAALIGFLAAAMAGHQTSANSSVKSLIDETFAGYDTGDTVLIRPFGSVKGLSCGGKAGRLCQTPSPRVHLRFQDGAYRFAGDLMRRRPMDEAELLWFADRIRDNPKWHLLGLPVPREIAFYMARLIYSGNAVQAWRFLDAAWPAERNDQAAFLHDFYVCRIQRSRFWPDIAALNGLPAETQDISSCPDRPADYTGIGWVMQSVTMGSIRLLVYEHDSGNELLEIHANDHQPLVTRWGRDISLPDRLAALPWSAAEGLRIAIDNYPKWPKFSYLFVDIARGEIRDIVDIDTPREATAFVDLDGRPGVEMVVEDLDLPPMAGEHGEFASQSVVLQFQDGQYRISTDLMRKPPLSPDELRKRAQKLREAQGWKYPALREVSVIRQMRASMLELIYSGNADQALMFASLAWPSEVEGKDAFILDLYQCELPKSTFWPAIAGMNGLPADRPNANCGR